MKNKTMDLPKIGDKIYVPTRLYIDRGEDDMQGGLATIKDFKVVECSNPVNTVFFTVEEVTGHSFNWHMLKDEKEQERLKELYGDKIAHNDPDYSGNTGGYWGRPSEWR